MNHLLTGKFDSQTTQVFAHRTLVMLAEYASQVDRMYTDCARNVLEGEGLGKTVVK